MEKVLTIVIPTYNMQDYLRRCLDSLIVPEEQMKQLEVLVINDGSKDNSSVIAHEYKDKYPDTFRVIDKENGNYGSCINRGLKEAAGKYIKILDADDWFDNDTLAQYLIYLTALDVDLVLTDFKIVYENCDKIIPYLYSQKHVVTDQIIPVEQLLSQEPMFYGQMHGFTYKTNILREMKYNQTEGISYTDQEYVDIPFTRVKTVCYYPNILYNYLLGREGQTMMSIKDKSMGQLMQVVLKICEFYSSSDYDNKVYKNYLFRQILAQIHLIYSSGLLEKSYNVEMLKDFDVKIMKYPSLYSESAKIKARRFPYVEIWRNNNRKESIFMKFIIKVLKIL